MYVKIIRRIEGWDATEFIECDKAQMRSYSDDNEKVQLILECNAGSPAIYERCLELNKDEASLFIMNSQGKTIDSYIWRPARLADSGPPRAA